MASMCMHRAIGVTSYLKNDGNMLLPHLVQVVSTTASSASSIVFKVNLRSAVMCMTKRKREASLQGALKLSCGPAAELFPNWSAASGSTVDFLILATPLASSSGNSSRLFESDHDKHKGHCVLERSRGPHDLVRQVRSLPMPEVYSWWQIWICKAAVSVKSAMPGPSGSEELRNSFPSSRRYEEEWR